MAKKSNVAQAAQGSLALQGDFLRDGSEEQFRLTRIQTFNWGTFAGKFDFPIPLDGYLFVGPSGSGKSTILDAHAALLTPPKWVDFNVAAREAEKRGKDRNVLTYVRGAWAEQTGDNGEYASQYLRTESTWSAIVETYKNALGTVVVLAQLLWVRGKSNVVGEVKKHYLVLKRELEIGELAFFPDHDFDTRRFKFDLPDAYATSDFSAFQERFRDLLGIENERALRLLHKTQSAKNLGDLNIFLRDFMLDAPETFSVADRLVNEFGELNAAHQSVVTARRQIEMLLPARDKAEERERNLMTRNELKDVALGVPHFKEQRRIQLLRDRLAELVVEIEGARQQGLSLDALAAQAWDTLNALKLRRDDMGGNLLAQLDRDLKLEEQLRIARMAKREQARGACKSMAMPLPDNAPDFVQLVEQARQQVLNANQIKQKLEEEKYQAKRRIDDIDQELVVTMQEVAAMERQSSNIPARLLAMRQKMAFALRIPEENLPFVGELLEVKEEEAHWQGAIERVLGGFARSLLVDEKHYVAVSNYLNQYNTGERIFYNRTMQHTGRSKLPSEDALVNKLQFAQHPQAAWLQQEINLNFDVDCVPDMDAWRNAARAVTVEGQVKHNAVRHEKNDLHRIEDRSRWVLGFDNKAKLALFKERVFLLNDERNDMLQQLASALQRLETLGQQAIACNTLQNLSWHEIDVDASVKLIAQFQQRIAAENAAKPELAQMEAQIKQQEKVEVRARDASNEQQATLKSLQAESAKWQQRLQDNEALYPTISLTQAQASALPERLAALNKTVTLDNLDNLMGQVDKGITVDLGVRNDIIRQLEREIEDIFAAFNREPGWLADSGGLDPVLASSEDYFSKLRRLQDDRLPEFEQRFLQLLHEQSDQNLTLLSSKLDQERAAIRGRMELVNESLLGAPFNHGTHLVIDTQDKLMEEVREFKLSMKEALSMSFSADAAVAEARFAVLQKLVKRLASQETADRNWRAVVLDVRQHVEFVARELQDGSNIELEVYRSGAGKSGGQRQKLAATCLAAALRYQLGGQDRMLPSFSTVVLDEAFDKADADFTRAAMNIFRTFGFQMIVATPMKAVMTLEPFIGGACYVTINERKNSSVLRIDYDVAQRRLQLVAGVNDGEMPAA